MKWLILALFMTACTERVYSERENFRGDTQSTYDVWDFEILSANENAGKHYRLAVINERHYVEPVLETEGSDGLTDKDRKAIPVGTTKRVVLDQEVTLQSIHGPRIKLTALQQTGGVAVNVTHVRSCPVTTSEREQTSIVGDSSKGIITIPKLKTVIVREFSKPACADPSDRLPTPPMVKAAGEPSSEVLAAIKLAEKEKAERELQTKINMRTQELENDFHKKARETNFAGTTPIDQAFCPRLSGLMRAAGVSEIQLDRREASRREEQGYTSITYESTAVLLPMNEKIADVDSDTARLFKSLKLDSRGCVDVTLTSKENGMSPSDFDKSAKELEQLVERYKRNLIYEQVTKELKAR